MLALDLTITATLRHEILFKTLYSFYNNLLGRFECRCIVNIDPVGPSHPQEVVDCCKFFFKDVEIRKAKEPHFGKAVKWVWEQVTRPWVFHLEDDWLLKRTVNLEVLAGILLKEKDLALLRLPQFKSGQKDMKNWNKFFPWNGRYYECPDELRGSVGMCGHPSLIRGEFVQKVAPLMDPNRNPEKQFHAKGGPLMEEVFRWRYGVFGLPGWGPVIEDIGRRWMVQSGYQKRGCKAVFTEWEKA